MPDAQASLLDDDVPAPPPFRPRAPWWGGDAQTLRNYLLRRVRLPPHARQTIELPTTDGSGDILLARLDIPDHGLRRRPLALLVHGLTGCEDSVYMRASAAALLAEGYRVLRLNLRGAGPSRRCCADHYHLGRSRDIADAFASLPREMVAEGVVGIGFSLGGSIVVKHAAEAGRGVLRAIVAVSAPIDPHAAARRMMAPRNALYHRWLLARMKAESTAPGARLGPSERAAIAAARSVYAFDDRFVAPRFGYGDAPTYYAENAATRFLGAIEVPTLLIHAEDDPWIPAAPYRAGPWRANPLVRVALASGGGHVGFHDRGAPPAWHNRAALGFFARVAGAG
ncbi:MAG: alpha/beta fold hydrolase [Alphaproteobacteria bacterium]|nr:alpha/beta fold hydrolase [Alphaproteobacteria bacterium]